MSNTQEVRSGGQLLVDALKIHGVEMVFGVPGESYLGTLDAFYESREQIKFVLCRQEGGAANMADAYGKLTGRPGVCFVTRGPGATHASIGIHTAFQDSTPLVLFIGQVDSGFLEREAFQEIDYRRMFGSMTKWVAQIDTPGARARNGQPRFSPRGVGPSRAGGAGTAGRHADCKGRGARCRALSARRRASRRRRHEQAARNA